MTQMSVRVRRIQLIPLNVRAWAVTEKTRIRRSPAKIWIAIVPRMTVYSL